MTDQAAERIAHSVLELAHAVRESSGEHQQNVVLNRLRRMENHILTELHATGRISTEDQALLDRLNKRSESIALKLERLDKQTS